MAVISLTTNLMNTFVGEDSWTYVKVGDKYLRIKGRDLNIGSLVVEHNEGITATLPQVEPVLDESFRYQMAKDTLHTKNANGALVKNFRLLLLRGLTRDSAEDGATLEQKIMLEQGADFDRREYAQFVDRVMNYVEGVGHSAVQSWLKGKYHTPDDWKNFHRLTAINPDFVPIAESFGQDTGYYASYMMFVGIRRTIMSYLAKRTGKNQQEGEGKGKGTQAKIPGKYQAEIELVLNRLMPEVDNTKSGGYVTKINRVYQHSKGAGTVIQPDPHLKKGVVTGTIDVPLTDINQVRDTRYLLREALSYALSEYAKLKMPVPNYSQPSNYDLETHVARTLFSSFALPKIIPSANEERIAFENNLPAMTSNLGIQTEGVLRLMQHEYDSFLRDIKSGHADQAMQLGTNTLANLVDLVRMYSNSLPKAYNQTTEIRMKAVLLWKQKEAMSGSGSRAEKRIKEREWRALEGRRASLVKYLESNYGYRDRVKGLLLNRLSEHNKVGAEVFSKSEAELLELKQAYEQQGMQFYSRPEMRQIMENLGIPSAVKLYDSRHFVTKLI